MVLLSRQKVFVADRGDRGRRLDLVVVRHLADVPGVSRTRIQQWIGDGRVTIDDRAATHPAQHVGVGCVINVEADHVPPARRLQPEDIPLVVLFEDDDLLVVDKPAGLVVHPTYGHPDGTLMNALVRHAQGWTQGRPSLVQRLDKHTSGLLVVAKSGDMHAAVVRALTHPDARKEYLALCYGRPRAAFWRLRYPLGPDPADRRRMIVRADGAEATTEVYRLGLSRGAARGLTVLCCRLLTGRTHQIRAHLRAAGLPIVGDPVYGSADWSRVGDTDLQARLRTFGRQALHAWRVEFNHPRSGRPVRVEAPIPPDIASLLASAALDAAVKAPASERRSSPLSSRSRAQLPMTGRPGESSARRPS